MAYDVFELFATDEDKELKGVEVELGEGATIRVARADNDNFMKAIIEATEANKDALDSLPEKEAKALDRRILCEVLADTILLDFKGMLYKGKSMKYSKANATKMLLHKDFRRMVMRHASNLSNFKLSREEKEVKN